jgi:ribonuclease R
VSAHRSNAPRAGSGALPRGGAVALLARHGRFLSAEPLFPPRRSESPQQARAQRRVAVRRGGAAEHARPGDIVLVDVPRRAPGRGGRGAHGRGAGAYVVKVIGSPDVARDVLEALMLDRGLPRGFAEEIERDAAASAQRVAGDPGARLDLRELPTFTIDPASARDFDDAVSAQRLPDGGARVWVHIADVAAHVREDSALDREARARSCSVYVPGTVEPMLPHALSSEACSLRPGRDRAAVTVELELDGEVVRRAAFHRTLIRSDERLDYERVDRIFEGAERARDPWGEPLRVARECAAALARGRERHGGIVVEAEEPDFEFDERGNVAAVNTRTQTESHRLIEQLMIAANEAVAELLSQRKLPCLYRVHERPDPERIERLVGQLASLQVPTPALPDPLSSTQAAELLGPISAAIERHVRRRGSGRLALESLLLRSLKQAYYSPENLGHAGLHSSAYCHFTSPIRRYPDIVCHRALLSALGERERPQRGSELAELGAWTSERERDAMQVERDADDIARCFALAAELYELGPDAEFDGEVTGLISAGAFVAFGDAHAGSPIAYEGMLPVRLLRAPGAEREWWQLGEEGTILYGERTGATLRLGDALRVKVARVDTIRGRVDLLAAG